MGEARACPESKPRPRCKSGYYHSERSEESQGRNWLQSGQKALPETLRYAQGDMKGGFASKVKMGWG